VGHDPVLAPSHGRKPPLDGVLRNLIPHIGTK
jgi:hypothetical protein